MKRFPKGFLRKGHLFLLSYTGQLRPDPGRLTWEGTWLFPTNQPPGPTLPFHILLVSLFLLANTFLVLLWAGLCCCTKCRMVRGKRETWYGQARDILYMQGSRAGVTRDDWLLQTVFRDCSLVLYPENFSNSYTSPAFHSFICSPFLSVCISKSRKSIFTPTVMNWKMNKRIKPFFLC